MNQSGATAGSKEFSSREQAAENQYARQKEQEQIKALKASLDAAKKAQENKDKNTN